VAGVGAGSDPSASLAGLGVCATGDASATVADFGIWASGDASATWDGCGKTADADASPPAVPAPTEAASSTAAAAAAALLRLGLTLRLLNFEVLADPGVDAFALDGPAAAPAEAAVALATPLGVFTMVAARCSFGKKREILPRKHNRIHKNRQILSLRTG
jgi:hypothetical protein